MAVEPLQHDEVQIELVSMGYDVPNPLFRVDANGHDVDITVISTGYPPIRPPRAHIRISIDHGSQVWHTTLHVGTCRRLVLTDRPYPDNALYNDPYGGKNPEERS